MDDSISNTRSDVFRLKGSACAYCGEPAAAAEPYFPPGERNSVNLEPICAECLEQKGDTVPDPEPDRAAHRWWLPGHPYNTDCREYYK